MDSNKIENLEIKRIRILAFVLVCIFGFLHAWATRFSMTSDGITYLDMADYFLKLDFKNAFLASWCPLYPIILSIAFYLFHPTSYWEFPLMHFVDYFILLLTFLSFDYFLQQFIKYRRTFITGSSNKDFVFVSDKSILTLSYTLFIYTSIHFISLWSPDMLFSASVYLVTGVILKVFSTKSNNFDFALLGITLGLGYLAKTPMFMLAFVYLFISFIALKNIKKTVIALIIFLLVSMPYIISISSSKGYLTIGESGKLNYAWYINDTPFFVHWQGVPKGNGFPIHPTRKIFNDPPVYEFNGPVGGTYPVFYDPTYWYEGIKPRFDCFRQICGIAASLQIYGDIFFKSLGILLFGMCLLIYMGNRKLKSIKDAFNCWILIVPALLVFIMFSLVHLEPRYIAAYIVLLWLGLYSSVRLQNNSYSKKLVEATVMLSVLILMISIGTMSAKEISGWQKVGSVHTDWEITKGLEKLGIKRGDKVATIGYAVPYSAYWARVAKVKIVAEIIRQDADKFWSQSEDVKGQVVKLFAKTGAKIIVTNQLPKYYSKGKWIQIGSSECYAYFL